MMQEAGEVVVRDLGSTNGIRINGQRVEMGRLKAGDELSIAHIRYRLDNGQAHDQTLADSMSGAPAGPVPHLVPGPPFLPYHAQHEGPSHKSPGFPSEHSPLGSFPADENALAAAVRKILPSAVAEKCRIQVIVQMAGDQAANGESAVPVAESPAPENRSE